MSASRIRLDAGGRTGGRCPPYGRHPDYRVGHTLGTYTVLFGHIRTGRVPSVEQRRADDGEASYGRELRKRRRDEKLAETMTDDEAIADAYDERRREPTDLIGASGRHWGDTDAEPFPPG